MPINEEEVRKVAGLSKLAVSDEESIMFTKQMKEIVEMVELLDEVNAEGVPTTFTVAHNHTVFREDQAVQANMKEELLKRVPETADGYIKVPAIMDDGEAGA